MILGLCATRRRALEEQTTFFAHYYIQYVSDRLNSSSNPEVFMPDDPMDLQQLFDPELRWNWFEEIRDQA